MASHIPFDELRNKWKAVLELPNVPAIRDVNKQNQMALMLENTVSDSESVGSMKMLSEAYTAPLGPTNSMGSSSSTAGTGGVDTFDPILISLLRRSMPNLVAYDLCGVQAMAGPTGLIFAMRSRYTNQDNTEAFYLEANTGFSGRGGMGAYATATNAGWANTTVPGGGANNVGSNTTYSVPSSSNNAGNAAYNYAGGVATRLAEYAGGNTTLVFPEMALTVEKVTASATSRQLKAEYSWELAQDLKAIHGLDAESELSNMLSTEILAEINREIVRTIVVSAVQGAQEDTTTKGIFDLDVDSNGRWLVEKFKGLHFQIEREANMVAKQTRRGKGNVLLCTADVASALAAAGVLSYTPNLSADLNVDDTGNTFAGLIGGRIKTYIDPYAVGGQYMVVGYRGANAWDAGLFYCPYVPLQLMRAVDPNTFQPKIAFKTRYAVVANPFSNGLSANTSAGANGQITQDTNVYYRRTIISHVM